MTATARELLARRALDPRLADRPFLLHEQGSCTWGECWEQAILYAHAFRRLRRRDDLPLHVGILSENRPEFVHTLFGCALAGGALVGLNPTRRGTALALDVEHTECQILVVDPAFLPLALEILPRLSIPAECVLVCDGDARAPARTAHGCASLAATLSALRHQLGAAATLAPEVEVRAEDGLAIIFTSGSSGAPKAIFNSHGKVLRAGSTSSGGLSFTDRDVFYAAMPLFHSNSLGMALVPALVNGATLAIARRFSASGFLPDVRRYGATVFNYVGKPLAYILATPERADDADNPLRFAQGAGATARQQEEFVRRFGLERIVEMYGSTESGATTVRRDGDPPGSCGALPPHLQVWNERDQPCPPAEVGPDGQILNYDLAIGEIVNVSGPGLFEGYYRNPEASAAKLRGGVFRSGDLGYHRVLERDGEPVRFLYFAGRTDDWIRKDGENFLADAVEEILLRHPGVALCSVYGVPCAEADELVMAAIVPRPGADFDPAQLLAFLERQPDLSPKWLPDYLRIARSLPETRTLKVLRRELKREGFDPHRIAEPLWWRERGERGYKPFTPEDWERVRDAFGAAGRASALDRG